MAIHHFVPDQYHHTFAAHAPALRVASGDTICTCTLDAHGNDANNRLVVGGSNPLTGPFFVDGAQPGDTLAVQFDALCPNRELGWSYDYVKPEVVDAAFAMHLLSRRSLDWCLDYHKGVARLHKSIPSLTELEIPLAPMLGCVGVAPARGQAISSYLSGEFGGNLDYPGIRSGVTLFLPVFEPGALLFIGDGHAVQGMGELNGSGVEVSLDVQFTVGLIKNKAIHWPRGETAEAIFTLGNARPLDQALRLATSEMLCWLQEDYGLDLRGASVLMGQCAEYELGNMIDPTYTIACKLNKRYLPLNSPGQGQDTSILPAPERSQ